MKINANKCINCKLCISLCPVEAIHVKVGYVIINQETCVECGLCKRSNICKQQAFIEKKMAWPRSIRRALSNPVEVYVSTGVTGRGTEEMKTNDVTERYKKDELGISIDVGRPNRGTTFREIEKITKELSSLAVNFEAKNPISEVIKDFRTGEINKSVLDEHILSGIIEFRIKKDDIFTVLRKIDEFKHKVDTVFTIGIIFSNVKENMSLVSQLHEHGWPVSQQAKINVGLGRK